MKKVNFKEALKALNEGKPVSHITLSHMDAFIFKNELQFDPHPSNRLPPEIFDKLDEEKLSNLISEEQLFVYEKSGAIFPLTDLKSMIGFENGWYLVDLNEF